MRVHSCRRALGLSCSPWESTSFLLLLLLCGATACLTRLMCVGLVLAAVASAHFSPVHAVDRGLCLVRHAESFSWVRAVAMAHVGREVERGAPSRSVLGVGSLVVWQHVALPWASPSSVSPSRSFSASLGEAPRAVQVCLVGVTQGSSFSKPWNLKIRESKTSP